MMKKCDFCDKSAVVHEVTVKNGIQKEVHLCQAHAAEAGIDMPDHQPITQLLTKVTISQASKQAPAQRRVCPECNLSFAEFRKTGTLGCPECYASFEKNLSPLIERAQNGATNHTGKAPKRAGSSRERWRPTRSIRCAGWIWRNSRLTLPRSMFSSRSR